MFFADSLKLFLLCRVLDQQLSRSGSFHYIIILCVKEYPKHIQTVYFYAERTSTYVYTETALLCGLLQMCVLCQVYYDESYKEYEELIALFGYHAVKVNTSSQYEGM